MSEFVAGFELLDHSEENKRFGMPGETGIDNGKYLRALMRIT